MLYFDMKKSVCSKSSHVQITLKILSAYFITALLRAMPVAGRKNLTELNKHIDVCCNAWGLCGRSRFINEIN